MTMRTKNAFVTNEISVKWLIQLKIHYPISIIQNRDFILHIDNSVAVIN